MFEASRHTLSMNLGGIDTLILLDQLLVCRPCDSGPQAGPRRQSAPLPARRSPHRPDVHGLEVDRVLQKFAAGIRPATNDFYMWYFTLTGIHLLHVVFGTSLLTYLWINSRRGAYSSSNRVVPECVASYWHLVDLLWVVIFPLLYLTEGDLMSVLRERVTRVWLGLMVLTCVTTWGLSKDLFSPAVAVVGDLRHRGGEGEVRDAGLHGVARRTQAVCASLSKLGPSVLRR